MDDYLEPVSEKVPVNGEDYLVQGRTDDPIHMVRSVDELLECERDNVQKMYGSDEVLDK